MLKRSNHRKHDRNFNGLFTLYLIWRGGHTSLEAARRLGVTAATVCECLKRLEAQLGYEVIDTKLPRTTFITDEGVELINRLMPAFITMEQFYIERGELLPPGEKRETYQDSGSLPTAG